MNEITATVDLTALLQAVVSVIATIITVFVIPWIRAKTDGTRAENLVMLARIGVQAAEQLHKTGKVEDKLGYVQDFLASHGFLLNTDEIEQAIEAAVYELTQSTNTPD